MQATQNKLAEDLEQVKEVKADLKAALSDMETEIAKKEEGIRQTKRPSRPAQQELKTMEEELACIKVSCLTMRSNASVEVLPQSHCLCNCCQLRSELI